MNEHGNIGWVGPLRAWSRLRFLSGDNRWVQQESTFWRRRLWDKAGAALDTRLKVANDFELWVRFFRHAELHTANRPLGCFRIRAGQRSIVMKNLYNTEARKVLSAELARLEPQYRQELRDLLPRSAMPLKAATKIRRDFRYAACDPPIIYRSNEANTNIPQRKPGSRIGAATAPDDLSRFKNLHLGERCFVMGNGPSLNKMNLASLAGQTVFGCNSIFLLFGRIAWRPRYYTCVDSRVLPDRAAEIDAMLVENPQMTGFFPSVIQEHTGAKVRRPARLVLPAGRNRFFFNEEPNSTDNLPQSMFSYDIDNVVVQPFTVAITMLQIAAYMGFSEIVLIGCDTNYVVADSVERVKDRSGSDVALVSRKDDDANHFDPRYFGRDRKWHAPRPEKMIAHYQYAKQALDAVGIVVYNATVGGKLEVFPRRDFESFIS
jgi:hypothetical protein